MRICIPTNSKDGKEAKAHPHFGSAAYFAVYETEKGQLSFMENANRDHSHGMCHPMGSLNGLKIDAIVCAGIGLRAVTRLQEGGIKIFRAEGTAVKEVLEALRNNSLSEITPENACTDHSCG